MSKVASDKPWRNFGVRLRLARMQAGMTQAQLAAKCKKNGNSWLVQLETGTNKMPGSMEDVNRLAQALNVTPEWLIFGRNFSDDDRSTLELPQVTALGIGGSNIQVSAMPGEDNLIALWPGSWERGNGGPPEHMTVVCSPTVKAFSGWVVWRSKDKYVVGAGKIPRNSDGKILFEDNDFPTLKAVGRVLLVIHKPH